MEHTIDSLFYEGRGCEGGGFFATPPGDIRHVNTFRRSDLLRMDGISVTYADGNSSRYGNKSFPLSQDIDITGHKKYTVRIYYLETMANFTMSNGEAAYPGAYGLAFIEHGKDVDQTSFYEYMIQNMSIQGMPLTDFRSPEGFEFGGLHGRSGTRIDKLGVIIQRQY
jgi:hypothetical protein